MPSSVTDTDTDISGRRINAVGTTQPYSWWDERESVDGLRQLQHEIVRADSLEAWTALVRDHLSWGNTKIASHVAIFNMNAASDCPNLGTDFCQVDASECYATTTEDWNKWALPARRRQEYLWDHLDAHTFARTIASLVETRRAHPNSGDPAATALRLNQAGDVRHRGDVIKANRIGQLLADWVDVETYLYTASSWLDWHELPTDSMTINASNAQEPLASVADRQYTAIDPDTDPASVSHLSDDARQCPYDATDGEHKCGDCVMCITDDAPDIYIETH